MSDPILTINGLPIPYGDIIKFPEISEEINYDSSFAIPDNTSVTLDNSTPSKYDHKVSGSLLYGTQIINLPYTIYEPDLLSYTGRGVIKNVSTQKSNNQITFTLTSQLSALANKDVAYSATGITPAEAIYNMITGPATLGDSTPLIDPSYVDMSSFNFATGVQRLNKCTINIDVAKDGDNNKKYSDVIPELLKCAHCFIYTHYDRIYLYQYTANKNPSIIISDILGGSYHDEFSEDDALKLRNSYTVAYKNGTSISYATGKNDDSIYQYGEIIYGIPTDDDTKSDSSSDMNILIDNSSGAHIAGEIALTRFSKPILTCTFDTDYFTYYFLKIGDIIGLNFDSFSNTPILLFSADYSKSNNKITFKGLFL